MSPLQVESIARRLEQLGYGLRLSRWPSLDYWHVLLTDHEGRIVGPGHPKITHFRLSVALSEALLWAEARPRT